MTDIQPAAGVLLIAPPILTDPNFRRTVVLLCEHGPEGSFGLVLNRPLELQLGEVMEGESRYIAPLSLGGPVESNTLHYLHRYGDRIPGAASVVDDVFWGGDFEALKAIIEEEEVSARDLRFFLGYAGWSSDQLEDEIQQGGWFLSQSGNKAVFAEEPDVLWRDTLRRKGGEYAILANFPDDPRMN